MVKLHRNGPVVEKSNQYRYESAHVAYATRLVAISDNSELRFE